MTTYIVVYDLISPGQNYTRIHEQIKSYGTWARPTESTWIVVTNKTAVQVRDHLLQYIDDNDRLLVVGSSSEGAWHNVRCRNSWLKDRL